MTLSYLEIPSSPKLAYHKLQYGDSQQSPTIVFLGGLMSDMEGTKAIALEEYCKKHEYNFIRFDYLGHGESDGKFTDGTISKWKDNVIAVIDNLTEGAVLLVGSSLGGWLMHLAALERKDRIIAMIGIAAAPDFTKDLMWDMFDDNVKEELEEKGIYNMPSEYSDCPYPITMDLITDGKQNLLLDKDIDLDIPVRLIHGTKDDDVPYELSMKLSERLISEDVQVTLVKKGDHRMSDDAAIQILCRTLEELLQDLGDCSNFMASEFEEVS